MNIFLSFKSLSRSELMLWLSSILIIGTTFILIGNNSYLNLIASLVGATALIFVSKGDVIGQVLTVVFSLIYAVISFDFRYFGEMITYLGMTAPIAILSVIAWLKNPFEDGKQEVRISKLTSKNTILMLSLTIGITFIFYFILKAFDTNSLIVSTISIATSFMASYLMLFRSPSYALAYATNDIVLVILWVLASMENIEYLPMVICFLIFLLNDMYGFYNWKKIMKRQIVQEHSRMKYSQN